MNGIARIAASASVAGAAAVAGTGAAPAVASAGAAAGVDGAGQALDGYAGADPLPAALVLTRRRPHPSPDPVLKLIDGALKARDLETADGHIAQLAQVAAQGDRAALTALIQLSHHTHPDYYVRGAERLAELALAHRLLPPAVSAIVHEAHPRLVPFLHYWAVKDPMHLQIAPRALAQFATQDQMVSADIVYIVTAMARVRHHQTAESLRVLLPHAGAHQAALLRLASEYPEFNMGRRKTPRTTQVDREHGREAVFVAEVLANPRLAVTNESLNRLAQAAHQGVPQALDALNRIAQGPHAKRQLARDLLMLLSRTTGFPHQHTAVIMVKGLLQR